MARYSGVYFIYNPNSTGPSEAIAKNIKREVAKLLPDIKVGLMPTKYAGHAEELAYKVAKENLHPVIVSSSGDGGYHEVINGAMKAQKEGAMPICTVLPAGNANDHWRTLHNAPFVQMLAKGKIHKIDLLEIQIKSDEHHAVRYAHSYFGLGLTPTVATELNKHTLNAFREILILLKTFYKFRPFYIVVGGKALRLNSLICGNINQMAKVLTISPELHENDGKFEVVIFPAHNKLKLLRVLLKSAVSSIKHQDQTDFYEFKTLKKMPAQLDGEVREIPANSTVTIRSAHRVLSTVI